jgi:hypothetical protein
MFYRFPHLQPLVKLPDHILNRYESQSSLCNETLLVNAIDLINESLIKADQAANKKIHFQITLTKLAYINRLKSLESELKKKRSDEKVKERTTQPKSVSQTITTKTLHPTTKATEQIISKTSITADLQSIKKKILEKDKKRNGTKPDVTSIDKCWKDFYKSLESAYLKQALKKVQVVFKDDIVHINVGDQTSHDLINKNVNFPLHLRQTLKSPNLKIETHIESHLADQKEETKRRFHTNKERYDYIVEQNPIVQELTKKLDLKLDN